MRRVVLILLALLFVAHHDSWLWDDATVVLGFLPAGLAYHLGYSLVAGLLWWAASRWCWPQQWEDWADEENPSS